MREYIKYVNFLTRYYSYKYIIMHFHFNSVVEESKSLLFYLPDVNFFLINIF